MKKIINGKMYNTETAVNCGNRCSNIGTFDFVEETLYRKRTGEYFLYGVGGARSKYAERIDANTWSGGSDIVPLTETEAREWAEKFLDADEYINIFGEPEE